MADPRLNPIATSANHQALDSAIRHAIHLERVKTSTVQSILDGSTTEMAERLRSTLSTRLAKVKTRGLAKTVTSTKQLRALRDAYSDIVKSGVQAISREIRATAGDLIKSEVSIAVKRLERLLPKSFTVASPDLAALRSSALGSQINGARISEWTSGLRRSITNDITSAINQGLARGDSTQTILRRIVGGKKSPLGSGASAKAARQIEALTRTVDNAVATQAREAVYMQNSKVIRGVRWVSVLDFRTTPFCWGQDGRIYPAGSGPRPPAHIQCRSTTAPVLKNWKEAGLRGLSAEEKRALSGANPKVQTYGQWLRSQPTETQDQILGKRRAQLFRSGKVKIDRFSDDTGRRLTLKELEAMAAAE